MTKLLELFSQVKDQNLSKEKLEDYYSQMSNLRAEVKMELATILKEKAMFLLQRYEIEEVKMEEEVLRKQGRELSVAQRKINWSATEKGQREIELKSYVSALGDQLDSLKTRIYSLL